MTLKIQNKAHGISQMKFQIFKFERLITMTHLKMTRM